MALPEKELIFAVMNFQFIEPSNPFLRDILSGYYITDFTEPVTYLTFPNNKVIVSSSLNAHLQYTEQRVCITPDKNTSISSDIICSYNKPFTIVSKGAYREITFVFNPLGFNQFLHKPLWDLKLGLNEFSPFDLFDDYTAMILTVITSNDLTMIQQTIESYWLSKLQGFHNEVLKDCIGQIQENPNIEISELAEKHQISRQYLNRLFKLHLCKSPSEFKKVQRFRNALQKHANSEYLKNSLTHLTYESLYYDQSHLIKDFVHFSKMSPSAFFKKNHEFENGLINWAYL